MNHKVNIQHEHIACDEVTITYLDAADSQSRASTRQDESVQTRPQTQRTVNRRLILEAVQALTLIPTAITQSLRKNYQSSKVEVTLLRTSSQVYNIKHLYRSPPVITCRRPFQSSRIHPQTSNPCTKISRISKSPQNMISIMSLQQQFSPKKRFLQIHR